MPTAAETVADDLQPASTCNATILDSPIGPTTTEPSGGYLYMCLVYLYSLFHVVSKAVDD